LRKQVSCQDFVITIREGRHQFPWHKKQEQSRISPSDTVVVLTVLFAVPISDKAAKLVLHLSPLPDAQPHRCTAREDVTRHGRRDPMRIAVSDEGYVRTFPLKNSIFAESEGYEPADFDRLIEISGESGDAVEIDENMLLEGMPDFIPPRE
jgi:hypothetical protein